MIMNFYKFEKVMILVAGMPASGKTTFAEWLSNKVQLPLVCKDKYKEIIWDKIHYDTTVRTESQKYGGLAYDLSFHFCDTLMKCGIGFIFESNFVEPFPEIMASKVNLYGYKAITVLFDGDVKEIHKRFMERDVTDERHPGLVSNHYFSDFEIFKNGTERCRSFSYGDIRITVDSTDFSKIKYDEIADKISASI